MASAPVSVPSGSRPSTDRLTEALQVTGVVAERIAEDSGFSPCCTDFICPAARGCPTLIAKLPAQSEARGAMELLAVGRELAFYSQAAGRAPMGTPRVYVARMARTPSTVPLEDLGTGTTPTTWPACPCSGRSWPSRPWPVCTPGRWSRRTALCQGPPTLDMPAVRDLLVPAFPGWEITASTPRPRCRRRPFGEHFVEHAPRALAALTALDAAARRHPRRQHVLRR
jgi:hypothetical protein